MDGQLMGEFDAEAKELEADSWSLGVEQQYLQQLDKELVKRQDVIYGKCLKLLIVNSILFIYEASQKSTNDWGFKKIVQIVPVSLI